MHSSISLVQNRILSITKFLLFASSKLINIFTFFLLQCFESSDLISPISFPKAMLEMAELPHTAQGVVPEQIARRVMQHNSALSFSQDRNWALKKTSLSTRHAQKLPTDCWLLSASTHCLEGVTSQAPALFWCTIGWITGFVVLKNINIWWATNYCCLPTPFPGLCLSHRDQLKIRIHTKITYLWNV